MFSFFHDNKYSKKRIYIDAKPIASPRISGVGHLLANTIDALSSLQAIKESYEIILVASPEKMHYLDQWGFSGVRRKAFPVRSRYINALVLNGLCPPIDLILGRGIYIFANYTTWPLVRSKSITYVHDISYERYAQFTRPKVHKILHKNVPKWIQKTNKLVTISNFSAQEIASFYSYPKSRIGVIYCGVDKSLFHPRKAQEIRQMKARYDLPENYILYVGSIEPRKNLANLIKAYVSLGDSITDTYPLVMVGGDGWKNDEIRIEIENARHKGKKIIEPKSYVGDADLPALYSGARACVFVPLYEGFGIPPLQAMACGVPCLLSSVASLPEVGGDAVDYCVPESVADISAALHKVLVDESHRKKLIEKGLRRADLFTWENAASQLALYINQL